MSRSSQPQTTSLSRQCLSGLKFEFGGDRVPFLKLRYVVSLGDQGQLGGRLRWNDQQLLLRLNRTSETMAIQVLSPIERQ